MKNYYVYVMANKNRSKYYIDFTDNLVESLEEHKNVINGKKQARAQLYLVYFEEVGNVFNAVNFKVEFQKWGNEHKHCLVEKFNPGWRDLFVDYLFKTAA